MQQPKIISSYLITNGSTMFNKKKLKSKKDSLKKGHMFWQMTRMGRAITVPQPLMVGRYNDL